MIDSMTSARERIGRLDVALTLALSALGILLMYGNVDDAKVDASPRAIPLFLPVTLPLLWRRVAPVAALGVMLAALLVHDVRRSPGWDSASPRSSPRASRSSAPSECSSRS